MLAGEHWTAFVPFAARWPIEVHLMPHRHIPDLAATDDAEREELATLYLPLLRGIDAIYPTTAPEPTVHLGLAPGSGARRSRRHPPHDAADLAAARGRQVEVLAGSEAAMGAWIGDMTPEAPPRRSARAIARA